MQRQQTLRGLATAVGFLIMGLAAMVCGWAFADTPIVILDGSLTMESAVPWNQFTGSGDQKAHPHTGKSVTTVTVTIAGQDQVITFKNEQCQVDITYASTDIKFTTGRNGKGLRVTPLSAFDPGETPNRLAHKNQSAKISHVTVIKAGVKAVDTDVSGGTKVVISYQ